MIRRAAVPVFLLLSLSFSLSAQSHEHGNNPLVTRGEVYVDFEPIYAGHVDEEYPLDMQSAGRRALEEAAMLHSAMIYGWSFNYEVGERARQIEENIELKPSGSIQFGDSGLRVTETEVKDMRLMVWTDYHLSASQQLWIRIWSAGTIRSAQAIGYSPSSIEVYPGWLALKKMAIEDAARIALRAALQGSERNRPKEVTGFISLASFPRFFIDAGRWAAAARFRINITEIIPFAAY
jgi:hypothetical protein